MAEVPMPPFASRKPKLPDPHADEHADAPGDDVELNSDESFPASDPPSWTPVARVGRPRPVLPSPGHTPSR